LSVSIFAENERKPHVNDAGFSLSGELSWMQASMDDSGTKHRPETKLADKNILKLAGSIGNYLLGGSSPPVELPE
jgi:hypothetical protein